MPAHTDITNRVRENLAAVREQIDEACRRAGRRSQDVRLVGVTKYVSSALARILVEEGCLDVAESRPQSLWDKAESLAALNPQPRWHLVGHLQRNKIRRTLPLLTLLHSLDSKRLLDALESEADAAGITLDVLVEINLADDPQRTGITENDAVEFFETVGLRERVRIVGLMGMASLPDGDPAGPRRQFARLRRLRDTIVTAVSTTTGLPELSMGMSGDFVAAILEGATLVRVGSALWEGIPTSSSR